MIFLKENNANFAHYEYLPFFYHLMLTQGCITGKRNLVKYKLREKHI